MVSRSDLRDVLWPDGTFVHFDHGLNSCIKQLRAALLDSRSAPRFLETLPRRGYRFIGPVAASHALESRQPGAGPASAPPGSPDFVVAGSARLGGGRVRVHLTLSDPGTGEQIWAVDFDCDGDDVRAAQTRITAEVLDGVAGALPGESRADRRDDRSGGGRDDVVVRHTQPALQGSPVHFDGLMVALNSGRCTIRGVPRNQLTLCIGILLASLAVQATDGPVTEAVLREIARVERDLARSASPEDRRRCRDSPASCCGRGPPWTPIPGATRPLGGLAD